MKSDPYGYPLYDAPVLTSIRDILRGPGLRTPDKIALEDLQPTPIGRVTYRELREAVLAFGAALQQLGLKEGDRVAVIGENRVQYGIAYLAAITHNFVAVPIDRTMKENEILTILHVSEARAAVVSENFRQMFRGFRRSMPHLTMIVDMDLAAARDGIESMTALIGGAKERGITVEFPDTDPEALALLVFTSGSMGSAKGVMLSQRNIVSNLTAMLQMIQILPTDRFFGVLPMHHTYEGTCGFLCPLSCGASVHYARSIKTLADDMITAKPTIILGVPLLYDKMERRIAKEIEAKKAVAAVLPVVNGLAGVLEMFGARNIRRRIYKEIHEKFGGAIRLLIVGAAAPDPRVARAFHSFGFDLVQGYGLTETSPILALNRLRHFKDEAAGLPLPNVEIRIDDPDPQGRGEIVVKGPSVMLGYYKNEEATRAVIQEGWFRTGDFGYFDADGFLHINGRKKNVIIARNGENVFPEELEDMVNKLPFVLESVVYGAKNEKGDEEIAVIVVPSAEQFIAHSQKNNVTVTQDLVRALVDKEIRELNQKLPIHKQIRKVRIKDEEFEKTASQKIKRYLVQTGEPAQPA